jgi:glycosyltransferase involved in cell wall biosynthesis
MDSIDAEYYFADSSDYRSFPDILSTKVLNPRTLPNLQFIDDPRVHAWLLHQAKQCIDFALELDADVDIIHGHFPTKAKLSAVIAANYLDIPCTLTAHDLSLINDMGETWLIRVLSAADSIAAISECTKSDIRNLGVQTPIDVVHMGIRPEKFNSSEDVNTNRLVTVARLIEKKGIEYAIEAVDDVVHQYPDIEHHVLGDGVLKEKLKQMVANRGLEDTVEVAGRVSDERIIEELDTASIFVLPSIVDSGGRRDGIPVALMEAMAMETAPISTTISGIPELISDRDSGLLVEPKNSDQLADSIQLLLDEPDLRSQVSSSAREKVVDHFNVRNEVEKLEELFQKTSTNQ